MLTPGRHGIKSLCLRGMFPEDEGVDRYSIQHYTTAISSFRQVQGTKSWHTVPKNCCVVCIVFSRKCTYNFTKLIPFRPNLEKWKTWYAEIIARSHDLHIPILRVCTSTNVAKASRVKRRSRVVRSRRLLAKPTLPNCVPFLGISSSIGRKFHFRSFAAIARRWGRERSESTTWGIIQDYRSWAVKMNDPCSISSQNQELLHAPSVTKT